MRFERRSCLAGLVQACLVSLLVSCGGGGGGTETAVSPPPTTPVTPPTTPAEPAPVVPAEPPPPTPPATPAEPPPTTPTAPPPSPPFTGTLSLVAGSLDTSRAGQGTADGFYDAVRFSNPAGLVFSGGALFVADFGNNSIRRISPIGDVTTYAGVPGTACLYGYFREGTCLDGPGVTATFSYPTGLAADANGVLYVTDGMVWLGVYLEGVRLIDTNGKVSTFRRPPTCPCFSDVAGIAVDANGNIYARSVNPNGISRFAPDGSSQLVAAILYESYALARDATGNLYVSNANSIEKVTPNGEMVHLAGPKYPAGSPLLAGAQYPQAGSADGLSTAARFDLTSHGRSPWLRASFAVDRQGNLYVSDINNHTIRKVTPEGLVTTIAGKAGVAGMQLGSLPGLLTYPAGLALQDDKTLFVTSGNAVLRIRLD